MWSHARWVPAGVLAMACGAAASVTLAVAAAPPARSASQTVGLMVLLGVAALLGCYLASVDAKTCHTAVSATVMLATSLGLGYLAQILMFDATPSSMMISGGFTLLLAVAVMAAPSPQKRRRLRSVSFADPLEEPGSPVERMAITCRDDGSPAVASRNASRWAKEEAMTFAGDHPCILGAGVARRRLFAKTVTSAPSQIRAAVALPALA